MARNTASEEAQTENVPAAVLQFTNNSTGENIIVKGEITNREQRYDAEWCDEWVTVTDEDGKDFKIRMADNKDRRLVKCNGHTVGNWYAFVA